MLSVITPVYNNGEELHRAINSVLQQVEISRGQLAVEIILINDGSNVQCCELLTHIKGQYSQVILLNHEENRGPAAARNTGLKHASGELISFIDGDDEWPENKLTLLLPHLEDTDTSVAGGKVRYVAANGTPMPNMLFDPETQEITHVHLGAILVKRQVFDSGMTFDENLRYSEDVNWWLLLREQRQGIVLLEEATLIYHVHGNNMSVEKTPQELDLLNVLRHSLRRRRETKQSRPLPQINDFRRFCRPLVSVIIPLYNGAETIVRTLDTVKQQTYESIELIVVDDGSSDGGAGRQLVAEHYPTATLVTTPNRGVAAARNTGAGLASGKYLAFLDQDDEWEADKTSAQVAYLNTHPYVGWVTCNQTLHAQEELVLPRHLLRLPTDEHRSFVPSALMLRSHVLASLGGFDSSLVAGDDTELIVNLRNAGFEEANIERPLLRKWWHQNNGTYASDKMRAGLFEVLRRQSQRKKGALVR